MVVGDGRANGDVIQRHGEARFRGVVERALEHAHGDLRALGQLRRQSHGRRHQRAGLDDLAEQAERERLVGADDPLAEAEI